MTVRTVATVAALTVWVTAHVVVVARWVEVDGPRPAAVAVWVVLGATAALGTSVALTAIALIVWG